MTSKYLGLASEFILAADSNVNQSLAIKLFAAWLDDRGAVETASEPLVKYGPGDAYCRKCGSFDLVAGDGRPRDTTGALVCQNRPHVRAPVAGCACYACLESPEKTSAPLCPKCKDPDITRMKMMGQDSYECLKCNEWGPWPEASSGTRRNDP
jgi:hypothetical protein